MSQLEKLKLNHTDQARKQEFVQQKENGFFNCRIVTGNGKLTAEEGINICELAKKYGDGEIAFATRQTVEIMGISRENLDLVKKEITEMGLIMGEIGPKIKPIVACKGSNCQYGLIDTFALAEKLHQLMGLELIKLLMVEFKLEVILFLIKDLINKLCFLNKKLF